MNKEMEKLVRRGTMQDTANAIAQGIRNYVWVKGRPVIVVIKIGEVACNKGSRVDVYAIKNVENKEIIDTFTDTNCKRLNEILAAMHKYNFKIENVTEDEETIKYNFYLS